MQSPSCGVIAVFNNAVSKLCVADVVFLQLALIHARCRVRSYPHFVVLQYAFLYSKFWGYCYVLQCTFIFVVLQLCVPMQSVVKHNCWLLLKTLCNYVFIITIRSSNYYYCLINYPNDLVETLYDLMPFLASDYLVYSMTDPLVILIVRTLCINLLQANKVLPVPRKALVSTGAMDWYATYCLCVCSCVGGCMYMNVWCICKYICPLSLSKKCSIVQCTCCVSPTHTYVCHMDVLPVQFDSMPLKWYQYGEELQRERFTPISGLCWIQFGTGFAADSVQGTVDIMWAVY